MESATGTQSWRPKAEKEDAILFSFTENYLENSLYNLPIIKTENREYRSPDITASPDLIGGGWSFDQDYSTRG